MTDKDINTNFQRTDYTKFAIQNNYSTRKKELIKHHILGDNYQRNPTYSWNKTDFNIRDLQTPSNRLKGFSPYVTENQSYTLPAGAKYGRFRRLAKEAHSACTSYNLPCQTRRK